MINKNKKIKAKKPVNKTATKNPAKAVKPVQTAHSVKSKKVQVNPFSNADCIKKNKTSFKVQRIEASASGLKVITKTVKLTPKTNKQFKEYLATNNMRRV